MRDGDGSIFRAVIQTYAEAGDRALSNVDLYRSVSKQLGITLDQFEEPRAKRAKGGVPPPQKARTARWTQQTMKARG